MLVQQTVMNPYTYFQNTLKIEKIHEQTLNVKQKERGCRRSSLCVYSADVCLTNSR